MNHRKKIFIALSATFLAGQIYSGSIKYKTEANVIVNGDFELDRNKDGIPDGWTRGVQMPGAKAEVLLEQQQQNRVIKIKFLDSKSMLQARVFQEVNIVPGKVYELSFRYKTSSDSHLNADVLMTGTGPLYRSIKQVAVKGWTPKKVFFMVPRWTKAPAAVYVQNRSTATIWYDDISLRATDIPPDKMHEYQPNLTVQHVTPDDQLIIGASNKKNAEFVVNIQASEAMRRNLRPIARLLAGNRIFECRITDNKVRVPVKLIPDGTSTLSVLLFDKNDNCLLSDSNLKIEKVPTSATMANLDLKNAAVFKDKNGKPFFPIGMYGMSVKVNTKLLTELRKNGFNIIHCYSFEGTQRKDSAEKIKKFLVQTAECELKVMAGLPRNWVEKNNKNKLLTNFINMVKVFPAVEFYYSDEMYSMRHTPLKLIKLAYDTIKKNDAKRQWIVYEHPEKKLAPYMDGIMTGVTSANTAKLIRLRLGDTKPVFTVFGQQDYKAGKSPALEEIRYNVFMPVILGARGLFYWWYPTLQWHNKEKDILKQRLFSCTKMLARIAPALVSGEKSPAFTSAIKVSGDVRYCFGTLNGVTYILAGVEKSGKGGTLAFDIPGKMKVETFFNDKSSTYLKLKPGELELFKISAQ